MPTTATNTTSAIDVARSFFTSYNAHYLGRTWMRKGWMNSPTSRVMVVEVEGEKAILGALALYLDFLNLFMLLLPLFGQRRKD